MMKKTVLLLLVCSSCFCAQAQIRTANSLKVDALRLALGSGRLIYEKPISRKNSIQFSVDYTKIEVVLNDQPSEVYTLGGDFQYRSFFGSEPTAPFQGYWTPFVSYSLVKKNVDRKSNVFGGGLLIGYQIPFYKEGRSSMFIMDFNIGGGYYFDNSSHKDFSLKDSGFMPRVGISFGWLWIKIKR